MEHNDAFKTCPFCQERIRQEAVKCRYCGEWMEKPRVSTDSPSEGSDSIPALELPPAASRSPKATVAVSDEKVAQEPATNADTQRASDTPPPSSIETAPAKTHAQNRGERPGKSALHRSSRTDLMVLNALFLAFYTFCWYEYYFKQSCNRR